VGPRAVGSGRAPRKAISTVAAVVTLALSACGEPARTPTTPAPPTAAPTATSAPAPTFAPVPTSAPAPGAIPGARATPTSGVQPQAQPTFDRAAASAADVENAFLSNVDDLIAEAADLTVTPCADLTQVTRDNPNLLPSIHGFAAAAKRIGASQAVLNTDAVKAELSDLDHSIGELDGALNLCGIKQP